LESSLLAEEGFNVRLDESSPALHFPVGDRDLEVEPAFEDYAFRFVTSRHPIHRLFLADYSNFRIESFLDKPFGHQADREHFAEGYRKAKLPE
jgi:hypothetical protein